MKRRGFIKLAAFATVAAPTQSAEADTLSDRPLKAPLRMHTLHLLPSTDGGFTLISDGPTSPQKLIRREVLDQAFGTGTFEALNQPDHWAMIDAGWFGENELYVPTGFEDPQYDIWYANYSPKCLAHDLLLDLFSDRIEGLMSYSVPDLGLQFATHPCSPRLATVELIDTYFHQKLVEAVAQQTKWIAIAS